MRKQIVVVVMIVAVALAPSQAFGVVNPCPFSCGSGHIFLNDTSYPSIEDIPLQAQTVNSTWKSLHQTTCTVPAAET